MIKTETQVPLRPKYLSQEEAKAIVELWSNRSNGQNGSLVLVEDVAEALHVSPSEVEAMLESVRLEGVRRPEVHPRRRFNRVQLLNNLLIASGVVTGLMALSWS